MTTLPAPWNWLCMAFLGAAALLLVGNFIRGPYDIERQGRMRKSLELPQSALLVATAFVATLSANQIAAIPLVMGLALCGMAAGFAGDLFMANVFRQRNPLIFGMLAFAAGHVLYMLAFWQLSAQFQLNNGSVYLAALVVAWIIALVAWFLLVRDPALGSIQYAALGYGLFLSSAFGIACGLALQDRRFVPLALGTALFVISDMILAAQLFGGRRFRYMADVVWATYIVAQALIVVSLLQASLS